jgi:hypothetical protein
MMPLGVRMVSEQTEQQQQQRAGSGAGQGGLQVQLLQWVWRYFTAEGEEAPAAAAAKRPRLGAEPQVRLTGLPPLYFQHEGHSRTVIGIERRFVGRERQQTFALLVLDPSTRGPQLAAALSERRGWQRLLRRGAHTLRQGQYQLLFVEPGLADSAEQQALKTVAAKERYGE